jgi:hypothetical protein
MNCYDSEINETTVGWAYGWDRRDKEYLERFSAETSWKKSSLGRLRRRDGPYGDRLWGSEVSGSAWSSCPMWALILAVLNLQILLPQCHIGYVTLCINHASSYFWKPTFYTKDGKLQNIDPVTVCKFYLKILKVYCIFNGNMMPFLLLFREVPLSLTRFINSRTFTVCGVSIFLLLIRHVRN